MSCGIVMLVLELFNDLFQYSADYKFNNFELEATIITMRIMRYNTYQYGQIETDNISLQYSKTFLAFSSQV